METYLAWTVVVLFWILGITPLVGIQDDCMGGLYNWRNSYSRRLVRGTIRQVAGIGSLVVLVWVLKTLTGYPLI